MVLDTSLLNTQQYKLRIEGKVDKSRERSSALPYTSVLSYLPTPRFLTEFNRFEFSFPSPRLVALPSLKKSVCPTIYP